MRQDLLVRRVVVERPVPEEPPFGFEGMSYSELFCFWRGAFVLGLGGGNGGSIWRWMEWGR